MHNDFHTTMGVVDFVFAVVLCFIIFIHIIRDYWLISYVILLTFFYIVTKRQQKQNAVKIKGDGYGVFITGCDSGIGFATAVHLDTLGFTVYAGCLQPQGEGATSLREKCSDKLHVLSLDVTSDHDVTQAVQYVEEHCPTRGLLAVVNNAAINGMADVELMSIEKYKQLAEVNLFGVIRVTKEFAPLIRKYKGRFINVTSVKGRIAVSLDTAYAMLKWAGEAFSDILRREMGRFGVKVIIIEPGDFGGLTGMGNAVALERMENEINGFWDAASTDVKQAYGRAYIDALIQGVREGGHTYAPTLNPVVEAMEDAITSESPEERYLVDGSDKMLDRYCVFARLNPFLPEAVMDFFISWFFPLPPVQGGQ